MQEACKKMEEFINEYGCPHDTIIITQRGAEFAAGKFAVPFKMRD